MVATLPSVTLFIYRAPSRTQRNLPAGPKPLGRPVLGPHNPQFEIGRRGGDSIKCHSNKSVQIVRVC